MSIAENGLGPAEAPALEALLLSASRLTSIDVGRSDMSKGYDASFALLASSSTLGRLAIREANLQQEGATTLAPVLALSSSLTVLDLAENSLNPAAVCALADAISSNPHCELRTLTLSRNCLGANGATAIANMLEGARRLTITCLDMSENLIRPDGSIALAIALRKKP